VPTNHYEQAIVLGAKESKPATTIDQETFVGKMDDCEPLNSLHKGIIDLQ